MSEYTGEATDRTLIVFEASSADIREMQEFEAMEIHTQDLATLNAVFLTAATEEELPVLENILFNKGLKFERNETFEIGAGETSITLG